MADPEGKLRIAIADPQYLTCTAVNSILTESYSIEIINTHFQDLLDRLLKKPVHMLIFDPAYPGLESLTQIAQLKTLVPFIMILINEITSSDFEVLTTAGIENIILKSIDRDELVYAVEQTLKGKKYYSEEILDLIVGKRASGSISTTTHRLTSTEMEIVKLIADGLTTKEIAVKKFISYHTVMTHRKNIFRKTGISSVSELIIYAIKAGWIDNIEYYI
jgi:DNA-binding NarL/FixJ family response regulator